MKKLLLCFLLLSGACCAIAQSRQYSTNNSDAIKYYARAGDNISLHQFDEAVSLLKNAIEADPNFIEAHAQLGDLYRMQQQYAPARKEYLQVLTLKPDFSRGIYLKLGEMEISAAQYSQAKTHLEKYITYPNITSQDNYYARKLLADCDFSSAAIQHPVQFKPINLGAEINTPHDEYLPVSTADEATLIFTRKISNNEDFYKSAKQNSKWTTATNLSRQINTPDFNEGAQSISQDGKYLFFTGCNRPDGLGRCDIYVSKRNGDDWSKPFDLTSPINSPGWESQPSISADGRTLYFVSNRRGGYGGYDIWKSTITDRGWGEPENLGPNINTSLDEQSPFIHPDDSTFYFCSNGRPGLGGKDLFVSRLGKDGKWGKPKNLGYPINSSGDENGLTLTAGGQYAFFASNNLGGFGGYDIYTFELPLELRPHSVTYVKGNITDTRTGKPLEATVEIIDLDQNKQVYKDLSSAIQGDFLATLTSGKNYALNISKSGYLFYSDNFSLKGHDATKSYNISVNMNPIEVGGKVVLKNIFFDTNSYALKPESKTELQLISDFLALNPQVKIEVSGHTDNVGSEVLNQKLSENRAHSVYTYLISHGINADKLVYKGYGKTQPVAPNTSDDNRAKNRRTEFKVIAK
jgi:outer membrane protein OmpA-like peptidoglycan-associated protein/tetratricopeptide (TPR) repeat protein